MDGFGLPTRGEAEMLRLILGVARRDGRIRAVCMGGSRANGNVRRDLFQDYDIVYVVRETRPFIEDSAWIDVFGERLCLQRPDEVDRANGLAVDFARRYGWLMLFRDGNRLDLHVVPVEEAPKVAEDTLCRVLLDKDGLLPALPEPSDRGYWVVRPTPQVFWACCNEFWWCLNNVAKGLWRREVPYAHAMLYGTCHLQLVRLLEWRAACGADFRVSAGKAAKALRALLPDDLWERFLRTYADGDIGHLWEAVLTMCALFDDTARWLAERLGLAYDAAEADASRAFLLHVRQLPQDAKAIFGA